MWYVKRERCVREKQRRRQIVFEGFVSGCAETVVKGVEMKARCESDSRESGRRTNKMW
jgi:hypothetical protein